MRALVQRLRERADPARSPAMAALLDDVAARLAASLSDFLAAPVSMARAIDHDGGSDDAWLRAAFRAAASDAAWDARVAARLSRRDLHLLVDILFGGEGGEPLTPDRPPSALERHVASAILTRAVEAARDAFAPFAPFDLTPDGLDIAEARACAGFAASFRFVIGARAGLIALDLPQQALAALNDAARPERPRPAPAADPAWAEGLRGEVSRARVTVRGVLEEDGLTLADLAALRVGAVLPLTATAQSPVVLACRDRVLFGGRLGQSNGAYTIQIEHAARGGAPGPQQAAEPCDA